MYMEYRLDSRRFVTSLALTAVFNTVIALFLNFLGFGAGFTVNFIFSQSIGLCMCAFILAGHYFLKGPSLLGHTLLLLITMPAGAVAGTFIGAFIAGFSFPEIMRGKPTFSSKSSLWASFSGP